MFEGLSVQRKGLLFVTALVIVFMQGGLWAAHRQNAVSFSDTALVSATSRYLGIWNARPTIKEHPIPNLMLEAENKYRNLLQRQSTTLEAAIKEYQRRYGRKPPRGFDDWWRFAKNNSVLMIDDYDNINEDLAPFWNITGEQLQWRAVLAGHLPSVDLVRVRDGQGSAVNVVEGHDSPHVSARASGFLSILGAFIDKLPDMDFPVNAMSEGRILLPYELRQPSNFTEQLNTEAVRAEFDGGLLPDWHGQGNVWEAFRRTCTPGTAARRLFSSYRALSTTKTSNLVARNQEFVFDSGVVGQYPFCDNPWAHYMQGHFFSDWRTIAALFPVFSPAKAPGYGDIRIPSHYYYAQTRRYTYGWDPVQLELKDVDGMEAAWEDKSDKIFWRGASTGGGSSPPGFAAQHQRHRFVRLASDQSSTNRTVVFADPPGSTHYVYADVPASVLNEKIMDVAFLKVVGAENFVGGFDELIRTHRVDASGASLGDHWQHKYVVDLDGMSYSGRFFSFLESDSAVLKATVYREFFSDWIQPWLHYIPLSQSYAEIYNIHAFFSGATEAALEVANATALHLPPEQRKAVDGDRRLRRIARAGKQWKRTMGRRVDMEAYVYRLCLEYARLWSEDRDAMSFSL
ncbi:capsular associated protein [Epithele typhae]|uniref:capsular associated protein n=1 Tax=Epithele typhae TaxID=378194 RepID=UPI002007FED7|nr:capsular associated protein [Epithele typhae]KAH9929114.1 capsular associated protein [Epithele typhae]